MTSPAESTVSFDACEERLGRLERSNRRLKLLLSLTLLLTAVAFTQAPSQSVADKIAAHQFVLVDDSGNECASWMSETVDGQKIGGGSLAFIGDDGLRLLLSTGNGNPVLMMNGGGRLQKDSRLGHASIGVSAAKGPYISLWGQNTDKQGDAVMDRSTELLTCWGENTHAMITRCGEGDPWTAP